MTLSILLDRASSFGSPHKKNTAPKFHTRFLAEQDVASLLRLEARQWSAEQAADESDLLERIRHHPELSVGSFCPHTGEAVSSLFMRPISRQELAQINNWNEGAQVVDGKSTEFTRSLFGISLTSVDPEGAQSLIRFFWPYALRQGWREIYLGSPIPGLQQALQQEPDLTVQRYVLSTKRGLPRDPQLRYYHHKGFRDIISVKPEYFPHPESLDHGVLLRGHVPLSRWWPLWRILPWRWLQTMSHWAGEAL